MAIIASDSYGYIICHETYINQIYNKTKCNEHFNAWKINPSLFSLFDRFKNNKNLKTKNEDFDSEVKLILTAYESLFKLYPWSTSKIENEEADGNEKARNEARKFFHSSFQYPKNPFSGGNNDDVALMTEIGSQNYIFPKKCRFYSCDVKEINEHLRNSSFKFILMDPPWWNKSVRRKRKADAMTSYDMLYDHNIKDLPIENLLDEDGLVAIWCTSSPSHINAVLTDFFPSWNIEFVSQWYWLKVTKQGQPVCAFSMTLGKQPYERIIFGRKKISVRKCDNPENNKVIISVPSAIHSQKPPVCELIKQYIPKDGACLELFARYLLPHWTSYGNEVIKLQHSSLYNKVVDVMYQNKE